MAGMARGFMAVPGDHSTTTYRVRMLGIYGNNTGITARHKSLPHRSHACCEQHYLIRAVKAHARKMAHGRAQAAWAMD